MSTTARSDVSTTVDGCRPIDVTPIVLEAESLESTAPSQLRELKRSLSEEGLQPAQVAVSACFETDCPFTTQEEIDRVREYVRAASFLGAGTVTVELEAVEDPETVEPALTACAERAEREGLQFEVDGPAGLAL